MKVGAIIPAAGRGTRIGEAVPKQFLELQGKPLPPTIILMLLIMFPLLQQVGFIGLARVSMLLF